MKIDTRDLGKRCAMNPLFVWEPGMLATNDSGWSGRVISIVSDVGPFVACRRSAVLGNPHSGEGVPYVQIIEPGTYPDLTDPATVGVLRNRINSLGCDYIYEAGAKQFDVTPSYSGGVNPPSANEALELVQKLESLS